MHSITMVKPITTEKGSYGHHQQTSAEAMPDRHGEPVSTGTSRNRWKESNGSDYHGLRVKSFLYFHT